MKVIELMVGDLIKTNSHSWNDETLENKYCKVEMVGQNYLSCSLMDNPERRPYGEENSFDPIPLTLEILEKNGFEKVLDEDGTECYRYYNSANDGYIKISLYNGGDGDWGIEIVNYEKFDDNKIVYSNSFIFLTVHKLQHALRLCGIEKEIKL